MGDAETSLAERSPDPTPSSVVRLTCGTPRDDSLGYEVLNAANAVITHNPDRLGKQLWTESGDGEAIDLYAAYNEIDEERFVIERISQWARDGGSHGASAILCR